VRKHMNFRIKSH